MFDVSPEKELAACCRKGDLTRATELLAYGVKANGEVAGKTYLALACEHAQRAIVELLLDAGARPSSPDVVRALRTCDLRIVQRITGRLDELGVEYDFWTDDRPILTDASFLAKAPLELVRWMLAHGADPNERDRFGTDPAAAAQKAGASPEIVALLTRRP